MDFGNRGYPQRISTESLFKDYGDFIPESAFRIDPKLVQEVIGQANVEEAKEPSNAKKARYTDFLNDFIETKSLIEEGIAPVDSLDYLVSKHVSKFPNRQAAGKISTYLQDLQGSPLTSVNTRLAGVGGGDYLTTYDQVKKEFPKAYKGLSYLWTASQDEPPVMIDDIRDDVGNVKTVSITRSAYGPPINVSPQTPISSNFLSLLENQKYPLAHSYNIMFDVDGEVDRPDNLTPDMQKKIMNYVKENAFKGLPEGSLLSNQPESDARASWYQRLGFGAPTTGGQFSFLDPGGRLVPVQPGRARPVPSASFSRSYGLFDPVTPAVQTAADFVGKNPFGAAGGAAMTLLNDEVAKEIAKDDYKAAGVAATKDVLGGAAVEAGTKLGARALQKAAPSVAARAIPAVANAARIGIPAAVGTGLFMQGRTGSALDTLTNKAATVVPGLRPNPQTDVGRRAGKAISNEAKYLLNSVLQNRVPYLGGRLF